MQDLCGDPGPAWPGNMCAACYNRSLYSSEETLLDRSKGSNGSNSHPKAGLSWPMAYPYLPCSASFCGCTWMCEYLDSKGIQGRKVKRTPPKEIHLSIVHALRSSWLGVGPMAPTPQHATGTCKAPSEVSSFNPEAVK